eukprot:s49_g48.t2
MAMEAVSPSRELHAPKNREGLMDEKALKRANRLAGVGQSVANMDLKAVADAYKSQAGGSGIESAAVAAAALNAALKAQLQGGPVDTEQCVRMATQEVQKAATKKARQAQGEAVIAARVAEAGYEGQARSEALKVAHDAHFARVMHEKNDRLAEDAATKKALREERAAAAASRRCLSEARARFARHWPSPAIEAQDDGNLPSLLADDPVVRKARALCSGVAQAVSQLEEQNQLLKSKPSLQLMNIPRSEPPRERKSPTPFQGPFDNEELIAKAKELLSDYKPEKQRLPSARSSARTTPTREPSSHGSPRQGDLSALQRARQQCTDVCVELSSKSRAMKRRAVHLHFKHFESDSTGHLTRKTVCKPLHKSIFLAHRASLAGGVVQRWYPGGWLASDGQWFGDTEHVEIPNSTGSCDFAARSPLAQGDVICLTTLPSEGGAEFQRCTPLMNICISRGRRKRKQKKGTAVPWKAP